MARRGQKRVTERNELIKKLYNEGMNIYQISKKFDLRVDYLRAIIGIQKKRKQKVIRSKNFTWKEYSNTYWNNYNKH